MPLPPNRVKQLNQRIQAVKGRLSGIPRPPARVTSQMPWDAQYESEVAQHNQDYRDSTANLAAQENNTIGQYGFDDTSNPFSRAKMLQSAFDQAKQRTWNSAAAAGQGYSGSTSAAISGDQSAFNQDYSNLRSEYDQARSDLNMQGAQNQRNQQAAILSSKASALERSISRPLDPSTAPPDDRAPLEQRLSALRARRQKILNNRNR
jgi:hypothetical protein